MKAIDELKRNIEETREELNNLITNEAYEKYYPVSQRLDALIEEYIDAQTVAMI